jgi:hypothetical protein
LGRVPSIPEGSAGPEDRAVANDYGSFAEAYSAETEANLIGYYARPAILDLAGDVVGRRILDVGCASATTRTGRWPSWQRAAVPPRHVRRCHRVPGTALPGGLRPALAEQRRVLKPGGRLIVSVDHPFAVNIMHREVGRKPDYFATYNHTAEWTMGGQTALMSFWHRPLHAMTDAFTAAGFRIAVISEPPPAPGARELFPDVLADKSAFLWFIFFVLQVG